MNNTEVKPEFLRPGKDDFFRKLNKEVQEKVLKDKKPKYRNRLKALLLLLIFIASYSSILLFGNSTPLLFLSYLFMGFSMILLFVNSFHDASHGALFFTKKQNRTFCYIVDLFGSNSEIWIQRHLILHHPYPNIQHWDCDIKQSDVVRIFPNSPRYSFHQYQHIYMWLLYPFYTLIWLFIRDFKDFFGTKDNYLKRVYTIPRMEYLKLFVSKIFNLCYMLLIPFWMLDQKFTTILLAWLVMHLCSSLFGVVALISTHVDEDSIFPEVPKDGKMNLTWAEHQMRVTRDFNAGHPLFDFLYGGFTHHVAHHLFPTVGHTYYPKITPIIQKYAEENQLPYQSRHALNAIHSHFKLLKNSGQKDTLLFSSEL
ncbi:fatty acid desaturase family protein [Flavobacterium sp. RSSA_27]|uniref:fatty acid desaturase family protein n=1 Tax=Flavobacterium sp. RSSA_27 TaxID=3447667 RepID=UPI003F36AE78